ncbi:hypothetical protein CJU90_0408 [Yarrowia sp. C11]|nr:hypothetical protein CKK34_1820 [Yarrowia sp. E02]KAG5372756.1 hypothetical protein CJU90_0408 [Yarrowia sp. C11]
MQLQIPAPYHTLQQPPVNRGVFICIDTETAEHHAGVITEIGVAVMRFHPVGQPDKPYAAPKISAQHFVVKERSSDRYRNGNYVPDHRDFFCYGTSQVAPLADIRTVWKELMIGLTAAFDQDPVYYVGHCISGDLNELKKMEFHVPELPIIDTEKIWRCIKKGGKGNLTFLLEAFCIPHAFLHNAGNDAYLNLMVFQALCDPVVRQEHSVGPKFNYDPRNPHNKRRRKKAIDYPIEYANDYETLETNVKYLGKLDGCNRFIKIGNLEEEEELIPRMLPAAVVRADSQAKEAVVGPNSDRYQRQRLSEDVEMIGQTDGPMDVLAPPAIQGRGRPQHNQQYQPAHTGFDRPTFSARRYDQDNNQGARATHNRHGMYNSRGQNHKKRRQPRGGYQGSRGRDSSQNRGSGGGSGSQE